MTHSISLKNVPWPEFQTDGGLLLPLSSNDDWAAVVGPLVLNGQRLVPKLELHLTLLNRALGTTLLNALGSDQVRRRFEAEDWTIDRTGDGQLLHKIKNDGPQLLVCGSIIERVEAPATARFRAALARDAGMDVPVVLPHMTLYASGDPVGIGLPNLAAVDAAHVADLRLPGVVNRAAPHLPDSLLASYQATDFVLDCQPTITLRVGQRSPAMDVLLKLKHMSRAIVVTAYNPFSETTDPRANNLRQQMLHHALHAAGLRFLDAEGRDPDGQWPPEPSLLVFGTTPAFEERLLRDYEQHAVVVVEQGEPVALALHPDHRS